LALPFQKADATTQLTNSDLLYGGGALTYFTAPGPGSVLGVSGNCQAITAGTLTLTPHKGGTEYAETGVPQPVLNATNDVAGSYATVRPGALTFVAGDQLGISVTTTTTLDPTNTLDVDATLFIQLNP
jgi:hypothetical protein